MSTPAANMQEVGAGVCAIDTEYARPLLDASHLIIENGRAAFVDTGANNAVPLLLDALAQQDLDVGDVDYLFLTHVHLDHAGGAGKLMQALPNARCVVHPRGAPHMANPEKLIKGTEAVYGVERARQMYGVIEPVDAARIVEPADEQSFSLNGRELRTLYTEGHAKHHYVLDDPASQGVFTGDSFGISYREFDTAAGPFIFPTTTPIDFDPAAAHASLERILGCGPAHVYLTHYSKVGDLERLADDMHTSLDAFVQIAEAAEDADDRQAEIEAGLFEHLSARLDAHGYDGDEAVRRKLLGMDVTLNAQGLSVWLDRRRRSR